MKIILGLFILLQTSIALAGLQGDWRGWGTWTYDGSGAPCDMNLSFKETEKTFARTVGYFDCTIVGLELEPVVYQKQGENLYDGDLLVGKITENSLELNEQFEENVTIKTNIIKDGLHFDYREEWFDENGNRIYLITGRMFLRNGLQLAARR